MDRYIIGNEYFLVTYFDEECTSPYIRTLVFIGCKGDIEDLLMDYIDTEDPNLLYFQDAESYFSDDIDDHGNRVPELISFDGRHVLPVKTLDVLVQELQSKVGI